MPEHPPIIFSAYPSYLRPIKLPITLLVLMFCSVVLAQRTEETDLKAGLAEAHAMCAGMTKQHRDLASASGYDIDKLCRSLSLIDLSADDTDTVDEPVVLPRQSDSKGLNATKEKSANNAAPKGGAKQASKKLSFTSATQLSPFGYELFAGEPTTFEPASRIPISSDYLLGPGDVLEVLFFGTDNNAYSLRVGRNGVIDFPKLGPIPVSGMSFSDAKEMLHKRISEQILGVEVSISLGELRSIQVFILGEAYRPGSYTVSSLSTVTNALFVSGGLSEIASLRNIEIKRGGKLIAQLDLYDLLLHGDTKDDIRLQSGDVIHIPSVKNTVSVKGEVRRPAIYELKGQTRLQDLLELAGGLAPRAYASGAMISRVGQSGFMGVVDVDLGSAKDLMTEVKNGDVLIIPTIAKHKQHVVSLVGHVHHQAEFLWRPGLRVSDIVKDVSQLKPNADLGFALIRRESPPVGQLVPLFVDLANALAFKNGSADLILSPRDQLQIFSSHQDRQPLIAKFVEALKAQAQSGDLARVASINGTVKSPGEYPLTENMTVTQLIAAAGGLREEAYIQQVELSRYNWANSEEMLSSLSTINLVEAYQNPRADLKLEPYDRLSVRTIPEFRKAHEITLEGEVQFPGVYSFARGETLSDVILRAGGLTDLAHSKAAVFLRESLKLQEQKQLEELQERLKAELATAGIERINEGKSSDLKDAKKLLDELSSTEALGRLVIELPGIMEGTQDDIQLKDGDVLIIPQYTQEVTVLGEVQQPTAHVFQPRFDFRDYIDLSGGPNSRADGKRIYIVKADGSVVLPKSSGWLSRRRFPIEPGDTVVVPLDVDRKDGLAVWAEASQIIYQLALGAAAVSNLK